MPSKCRGGAGSWLPQGWRLAGWCVRLQCHRRAAARMWQRLAAVGGQRREAHSIAGAHAVAACCWHGKAPFDCRAISSGSQRAADVAGGLLVGAFDCSDISGLLPPRQGAFDCRVPSASCGAHAEAASCRHGKAHSIASGAGGASAAGDGTRVQAPAAMSCKRSGCASAGSGSDGTRT